MSIVCIFGETLTGKIILNVALTFVCEYFLDVQSKRPSDVMSEGSIIWLCTAQESRQRTGRACEVKDASLQAFAALDSWHRKI